MIALAHTLLGAVLMSLLGFVAPWVGLAAVPAALAPESIDGNARVTSVPPTALSAPRFGASAGYGAFTRHPLSHGDAGPALLLSAELLATDVSRAGRRGKTQWSWGPSLLLAKATNTAATQLSLAWLTTFHLHGGQHYAFRLRFGPGGMAQVVDEAGVGFHIIVFDIVNGFRLEPNGQEQLLVTLRVQNGFFVNSAPENDYPVTAGAFVLAGWEGGL